jgi:hypothetical protein
LTEPVGKTLVAILDDLNVGHDGGLALAQIYASVESGIIHAFYGPSGNTGPPDPDHPEVPSGSIFVADVPTVSDLAHHQDATVTGAIDILDVVITAAGDLQVLVNPLTPLQTPLSSVSFCYLRQSGVQDVLNDMT